MKKVPILLLCAALLLTGAACSNNGTAPMANAAPQDSYYMERAPQEAPAPSSSPANGETGFTGMADGYELLPEESGVYVMEDAKLIRRANLSMETLDFDAATKTLNELVVLCGGYYGNNDVYSNSAHTNRTGTYTIRIPKGQYNTFMTSIGEVGQVTRRIESTEDVGEQYYNTEMRLRTLETKHERLVALLAQAADMETIVYLETTIAEVEYEIDRYSGTLRRYDGLIDYATIELSLYEKIELSILEEEEVSFATQFGQAFAGSFQSFGYGLQNLAIGFAAHFVGIVIFALLAVLGWGIFRKVRKKRSAVRQETSQTMDSEPSEKE